MNIDILRPPTFEQLAKVLNEKERYYHALHFDGHGVFPEASGGLVYGSQGIPGHLLFESEDGGSRAVSGTDVGQLLAGKNIPLVLLNACQSGMTRPGSNHQSVGNQLLKAGCCGVVAMSYSVYVQTAVRFMARLYEALINGEELARAVSLARADLIAHPQRISAVGDTNLQDWIVPVLFEGASVTPLPKRDGAAGLQLNVDSLDDEQAKAGAEIDCPEPPVHGFVGRDNLVLDLERAFRKETIVLLEGMAGIGKTEMAAGFARWWAETGALDGPIFFFKFEHHLPLEQVIDRVGQVFGPLIKAQVKEEWHLLSAEKRRGYAVQILKRVPCFMIWDNFEPVHGFPTGTKSFWTDEEQEDLRKFLVAIRGGATKVLISSRRDEGWLGDIYRKVTVSGLRLHEAQELALSVLRRKGLNSEQIRTLPDYNELLEHLGGNPLAIQVILPELERREPSSLLEALITGELKLSGDDPAQGRERSLAASLNYRLDALDDTLRQRLGILALFQGFVDADVLAYMCCKIDGAPETIRGLDRDKWIPILDSATEVGLLRRVGEGCYTIHPAIPWFFHDLMRETYAEQIEWLERSYVSAYGALGVELTRFFQTKAQLAMALMRYEEGNLWRAVQLGRTHEQWDEVADVLYGLQKLLTVQGRWLEWERLLADLEKVAASESGEPMEGRDNLWIALQGHRAELAQYRRDLNGAKAIHLKLKDHFQKMGDDKNTATALHQLGRMEEELRQFDEAEKWYRQSLEIKTRIGDEHGQAATLHQLGIIAEERRQFDEAEKWYRQSLEITTRIGNEHGQAITLHQLGTIAQERRDFDEAEKWYRQSLEIKTRIGDERAQATTIHQLGIIAQERRNFDEAEKWYRQSLEIAGRIGDEQGQAITLHQLGMIAQERRDFDEAEKWYRQSLGITTRIGDEHKQAMTLHQLGIIAQERRQFDEAEKWYRQSLEIKRRIGDKHGQASSLFQLGRVAEEKDELKLALELFNDALRIVKQVDDPYHLEMVQRAIARVKALMQEQEKDKPA